MKIINNNKYFYNHKDLIQMKSGVYKIKGLNNSCIKAYIGETKRHFNIRLNEHKSYVKNKKK